MVFMCKGTAAAARRLAARIVMAGLVGMATAAGARADAYEVPIYHATESAANGGKRNFLVYASVGGGPLNPYLFDTGSRAMFSTYGAWWPGHTTVDDGIGKASITYASGTVYHYDTLRTDVSLGDRGGTVIATARGVRIARITNVGNTPPAQDFRAWRANDRGGRAPFTSDGTYGNFGGGLEGDSHLGTVLAQFPLDAGLKRGFVVMSGGRTAPKGKLVVGLSAEMIAAFPWRLPMAATKRRLPPAAGAARGAPGYRKAQVRGTVVRLERGGRHWEETIPTVFDTGGGNGTWIYGAEVSAAFVQGGDKYGRARFQTDFALSHDGQPLLAYASADKPASNILGFIEDARKDLRINPGILMFYTYDVMFNLDDGYIGLRPATKLEE